MLVPHHPVQIAGKLTPGAEAEVKKIEDTVRFHFSNFPMREVEPLTLNRAIYEYITKLTDLIIKIDEDGRVQFPIPEAINTLHDMASLYAMSISQDSRTLVDLTSMRLMTGYGICIRTCYFIAKKVQLESTGRIVVPEVGTPDPPVWTAKYSPKKTQDTVAEQC